MSLISHKKIFYVNSKNRLSGTNSDFAINLPLDPTDDFDRVSVMQASIPKSYYLIQDGLNTFTVTEDVTSTTITIPPGNYTRRSIQVTVENLLNGIGVRTYSVSWPSVESAATGKFTFTVNNIGGVQPIFTFSDNNIGEVLGFDLNSSNQFSGFSLVSTNVINLQLETTLYLHSDICTNGHDDVLQEIYSSGDASYSNIVFQNFDLEAYSKKLVSKNKQYYTFKLTNEDGQPIDLNGVSMQLSLILFKHNDIYGYQKQFIQYQLLTEQQNK
jgi:hypothetical protein